MDSQPRSGASPGALGRSMLEALLRIACCVVLFAWALSKVDLNAVYAAITPRLAAVVFAGSVVITATAWLQAARWRSIASALKEPLDRSISLRASLLSYFLLTVTPATVAADGARIVMAGKERGGWSGAAQSVVIDRAFGLFALLFLALISLPLIALQASDLFYPIAIPVVALWVLAAAGMLLLNSRLPRAWLRYRPVAVWARMLLAFKKTIVDRRVSISSLLLSLLIIGVSLGVFWAIAATVGARADLAAMLILFPPMLLISVLPISVNGWGVRELSLVAMYPYLGTSPNEAMAASLAFGLAVLGAGAMSLAAWWIMRPSALRQDQARA